jgi:ribosomal protein L21
LSQATQPSQTSTTSEILKKLNVKDPAHLISWKSKYLKPEDITPLKEAKELYATIHIYDRKFLVTEGDEVRIPVDFKTLEVGDVLNLNEVSTIGSRDHTLTGGPRIDPSVFNIRAVVIEKTKVKHRVLEKTRRRRRHVRHVVVKPPLTVLRISQLSVNQDF